ncbi:MAG TPA: hypothetical protein VK543_13695, partial [Puia sp.]|nr:hypothetical protein [Puia sp.]
CRKNQLSSRSVNETLVDNARSFFLRTHSGEEGRVQTNSNGAPRNFRLSQRRTLQWDKASIIDLGIAKAVIVPVKFNRDFYVTSNFSGRATYSLDNITRLYLSPDSSGGFNVAMLSFFPDSNYITGTQFTGIAFVEDWEGNAITKYKFDKNNKILQWTGSAQSGNQGIVHGESVDRGNMLITETCYTITGYNYSADNPNLTYPWSEPAGCAYSYVESISNISTGGGLSGSGFGAIAGSRIGVNLSPGKTVIIAGGTNIIGNIKDYTKCFSNVATSDHSFTVTVCVDQPLPGSRQPWGFTGTGSSATGLPVDVGHCFLVLTENYPGGSTVRNVGFYPSDAVNPLSPSTQGQLNNDASHSYNISLTIKLTNTQFSSVLNYVTLGNNLGFNYNLNSNNCTTFVLHALNQAGIYLPATSGSWPNGSGNDPGDLGEDIRLMQLSTNMTRNTVFNYHPNFGNCY